MTPWQRLPFALALTVLQAQTPASHKEEMPTSNPEQVRTTPLYRMTVVQGSAKAINYRNLKTSTKIGLQGTVLTPKATGVVKVRSENGIIHLAARIKDLPPASSLGGAFLTYVLWGISPEGRATNLGEVILKNAKSKLEVTEGIQTFGLVVTAEPYFAVCQPSDAVVMENTVGKGASGQVELIEAKFELLKRGQYTLDLAATPPKAMDPGTPFDVYQARNAVTIARASGAPAMAGEAFSKAVAYLKQAEAPDGKEKDRIIWAREAIQRAEDSRLIAVQRQEAQRTAMEKKAVQDQLDEARMVASQAASAESQAREQAGRSQLENKALRNELIEQFSDILQTRSTARGLIVNMSGVLFQTGKAELAPAAREKLAKIAGILAAHKGLKIEANGYTDSTGSERFNRQLSQQRAMVTKDFLVSQGVAPEVIGFKGFGDESPIAPNDTDAGRQENRRVELVVTGEGLQEAHEPQGPAEPE